jgi:hypothetical protein
MHDNALHVYGGSGGQLNCTAIQKGTFLWSELLMARNLIGVALPDCLNENWKTQKHKENRT